MHNDLASRFSLNELVVRAQGQVATLRAVASATTLIEDASAVLDMLSTMSGCVEEMAKAVSGAKVEIPLGVPMVQVERLLFSAALVETRWNKTLTAKLLGLSRRTVYNRLVAINKEAPEERVCARCHLARGPWRYYNLCERCHGVLWGERRIVRKKQREAIRSLLVDRGVPVDELAQATRVSPNTLERLAKSAPETEAA